MKVYGGIKDAKGNLVVPKSWKVQDQVVGPSGR